VTRIPTHSVPQAADMPSADGVPCHPPIRAPLLRSPLARRLLMLLAVASLCMAVVGVFLPGLPSTEFVLLAAWASARSSPRLHAWLVEHKWFGPMLYNWNSGRRIARRTKWWAAISMSLCASLMLRTIHHPWFVWPCIACMAAVLYWIWCRPEP
jgi:uncharacterized membrane protein YbaN (DUF454 family)